MATLALSLRLQQLEARDVPATLLVDDNFAAPLKPGRFDTIQAAIDAADPNDTIKVRAGTYAEQVRVGPTKSGLKLLAQGPNVTITTPAAAKSPLALVDVSGADRVVIDGFTVAGPIADADLGAGILVENGGSATIRNNTVRDIATSPLSGGQYGNAIQVGGRNADGTRTSGRATVENNTVLRYQKTGIFVANAGSSAEVRSNTVVGAGPTNVIAQNGIQVSDGAFATVSGNTVSGNVYTPAGIEATGILIIQAGGVTVSNNFVVANEIGIAAVSQAVPVAIVGNTVVGSTQDGVQLTGTSGAYVAGNVVAGSGRDGIRLNDTKAAVVLYNSVTGSGEVGLHVSGASAGNVIAFNRLRGNRRFDALDETTGFGSGGTADFWFLNSIGKSGTPGLS